MNCIHFKILNIFLHTELLSFGLFPESDKNFHKKFLENNCQGKQLVQTQQYKQ